jgi:hypothetical protein
MTHPPSWYSTTLQKSIHPGVRRLVVCRLCSWYNSCTFLLTVEQSGVAVGAVDLLHHPMAALKIKHVVTHTHTADRSSSSSGVDSTCQPCHPLSPPAGPLPASPAA